MTEKIIKLSNNEIIERVAEIMHQDIFRKNTDYENLPTYLREYGIDVSYAFLEGEDGFLQVEKGMFKPIIVVKAGQGKLKQRYTMAYELGYLMLYLKWNPYENFEIDGVVDVVQSRDVVNVFRADDQKERDTNLFALNFLMPKSKVDKLLGNVTLRSEAERILSDVFSVTVPVARLRILSLSKFNEKKTLLVGSV